MQSFADLDNLVILLELTYLYNIQCIRYLPLFTTVLYRTEISPTALWKSPNFKKFCILKTFNCLRFCTDIICLLWQKLCKFFLLLNLLKIRPDLEPNCNIAINLTRNLCDSPPTVQGCCNIIYGESRGTNGNRSCCWPIYIYNIKPGYHLLIYAGKY